MHPTPSDDTPCLVTEARDYPEWHRGRPRYAAWVILVPLAEMAPRVAAVREALGDLVFPGSTRQPHITLSVCGFPTPVCQADDDFPLDGLAAQIQAVQAARITPFELSIGGPDSFVSAAYLRVDDPRGALAALRQALHTAVPAHDTTPYQPHLTTALYARSVPMGEVRRRLATLPAWPPLHLTVRSLAWVSYDSRALVGELRVDAQLSLGDGP